MPIFSQQNPFFYFSGIPADGWWWLGSRYGLWQSEPGRWREAPSAFSCSSGRWSGSGKPLTQQSPRPSSPTCLSKRPGLSASPFSTSPFPSAGQSKHWLLRNSSAVGMLIWEDDRESWFFPQKSSGRSWWSFEASAIPILRLFPFFYALVGIRKASHSTIAPDHHIIHVCQRGQVKVPCHFLICHPCRKGSQNIGYAIIVLLEIIRVIVLKDERLPLAKGVLAMAK